MLAETSYSLLVDGASSQLTQKEVFTGELEGDRMTGTFEHFEHMISVRT